MSPVTLSMQMSLDGRTAGPHGEFDWPIVGDELLGSFNEEAREAATFLYGRRMYEEMAEFWPTGDTAPGATASMADHARIWRPMPKVVFSDSLQEAGWDTRIVRGAGLVDAVRELRARDGGRHILYGGADLAAALMAHDLVDEFWLFVHPVVLGGGPRLFGDLDHRTVLEPTGSRTFPGGVAHLRYRTAR